MSEPREDEQLCAAVISRDASAIERASKELQDNHSSPSFSRATITAIDEMNLEALSHLLQYSPLDEDIAQAAAASESTRVVQLILDQGWDVNRPLCGGQVPSMLSFAVRNESYLDWMLAMGANPNATSNLNETALSIAIREGTMKVVKKLLELDIMDTSRGDLLHCAIQREESADTAELIDRLILEKNAQVDAYEYDNDIAGQWRYGFPLRTPLHIACEIMNITAAKALLRHGANARQLKKQCNDLVPPTPLELATDKPDLQALLLA